MNKKFSTLVAALLVSGGSFVVASQYMGSPLMSSPLAMAAAANLRATGAIVEDYSVEVGAVEAIANAADWTLEKAPVTGTFYVKTAKGSYLCVDGTGIILKKGTDAGNKLTLSGVDTDEAGYVVKSNEQYLQIEGGKLVLSKSAEGALALFDAKGKVCASLSAGTVKFIQSEVGKANYNAKVNKAAIVSATELVTVAGVKNASTSAFGTGVTDVAIVAKVNGSEVYYALEVATNLFAQLTEKLDAIEYVIAADLVPARAELDMAKDGAITIGGKEVKVSTAGLTVGAGKTYITTTATLAADMSSKVVTEKSAKSAPGMKLLTAAKISSVTAKEFALKVVPNTATIATPSLTAFKAAQVWTVEDGVLYVGDFYLASSLAMQAITTAPAKVDQIALDKDGAVMMGGKYLTYSTASSTYSTIAAASAKSTDKLYLYTAANAIVTDLATAEGSKLVLADAVTTVKFSGNGITKINEIEAADAQSGAEIPGMEVATVDENGNITAITGSSLSVPVSVKGTSGYLTVENGKVVWTEKEMGANSAWMIVDNKLMSVSQDRAGAAAKYLANQALKASTPAPYVLSSTGETLTLSASSTLGSEELGAVAPSTVANPVATATVLDQDLVKTVGSSWYLLSGCVDHFIDVNNKAITAPNEPTGMFKVEKQVLVNGDVFYSFYTYVNGEKTYLTLDGSSSFKAINNVEYYKGVALQTSTGKYVHVSAAGTLEVSDTNYSILGLYQVGEAQLSVADLIYFEENGFSMGIKGQNSVDGKWTVVLKDNYFVGHLTPMKYIEATMKFTTIPAAEAASTYSYYLKNANGKYIVASKTLALGSGDYAYQFKEISESDLLMNINYVGEKEKLFGKFTLNHNSAYSALHGLSEISSISIQNEVDATTLSVGRLNILSESYLSATDGSIALLPIKMTVGDGQVADWTKVLSANFFTVQSFDAKDKSLGLLTASSFETYVNPADGRTYGLPTFGTDARNVLETQWALTYDGANYVFKNRENPAVWYKLDAGKLYVTETANVYSYNGTKLIIAPVEKVSAADGYKRLGDVKNQKFNIGYWSKVYNMDAWLTEKHDSKTNDHVAGLDIDKENALILTAKEYAAPATHKVNASYADTYTKSDSIYVISELGYYNAATKSQKMKKDTLKVVSYSFVNQYGEPLAYVGGQYVSRIGWTANNAHFGADRFTLREADGHVILRKFDPNRGDAVAGNYPEAQTFDYNWGNYNKMYAGDTADGKLILKGLFDASENDLFDVVATDVPMYRKVVNALDTIAIHRDSNDKETLYESNSFLGLDNTVQFDKIAPAMIADTGMVSNTYRPTYLLAVGAKVTPAGKYCPVHGADADCKDEHLLDVSGWVTGRYLVNLKDTAIAWDAANKHKDGNPYTNSEKYYRLGFVQATHINDTLAIAAAKPTAADSIYVGDGALTAATFAFRYVDQAAGSFVIETADFNKIGEYGWNNNNEWVDVTGARKDTDGYIKWMNGVVVVVDDIKNADIFNMKEGFEGDPTANEAIAAEGVQVIAGKGVVTVQGAAGKVVTVSNILGQTIANQVAASDNVTIAAPAGVVVVAVDGEATKVVVK